MKEVNVLTKKAAEQFAKHEGELFLGGLTELSDAAAESLAKHRSRLWLIGGIKMSDAAIEALSKKSGTINARTSQEWAEKFKIKNVITHKGTMRICENTTILFRELSGP